MAPDPLKTGFLIRTLMLVAALEGLAWLALRLYAPPIMAAMGIVRCLQIAGMLWAVHTATGGFATIGLSAANLRRGVIQGALWSAAFGLAAGIGMAIIHLSGRNPLMWLRSPLPAGTASLVGLFLVGGIIAPVAEEICFRGLLYGYFRRWGIPLALIVSTGLFVALHSVRGVPITQVVGGLVFAAAYETSRNLLVPMTIHVLGNLALFTLSLPFLD